MPLNFDLGLAFGSNYLSMYSGRGVGTESGGLLTVVAQEDSSGTDIVLLCDFEDSLVLE